MYSVGDLIELLSFFDRISTGVYGIITAVHPDRRSIGGHVHTVDYQPFYYYTVTWLQYPHLPTSPVYPEDIILVQKG